MRVKEHFACVKCNSKSCNNNEYPDKYGTVVTVVLDCQKNLDNGCPLSNYTLLACVGCIFI